MGFTQGHMGKEQQSWGLSPWYLVPVPCSQLPGQPRLVEWETLPLRAGSVREGSPGTLTSLGAPGI